ncbi:hypothetical protein J2Z18_000780 [Paenibacillus lactis]|uniref:Uncharacterized protein n=1 Tax=Paenibacillus lactis TaxID=228574 RepID=A0ABS4F668_9BACL|nr:hypothetical protein [Paenibacillus lactis]
MQRAGVGVQSARNVRGHDRKAARIGGLDQFGVSPAGGARRSRAQQRVHDPGERAEVHGISAVDQDLDAERSCGIPLQCRLAGKRRRLGGVKQRDAHAGVTQIAGGGCAVAAVVALARQDEPVLLPGRFGRQKLIHRHRRRAGRAQAPKRR